MLNDDVLVSPQDELNGSDHDQRSLNEMLQELRVLQQGSQILAGFLVLLPFSEGFAKIAPFEKWVYIVAFIAAIISLICFSAPAAQHRIERPLRHRIKFKRLSTRIIIAGTIALSVALISTTQLVLNEVVGDQWASIGTAIIGILITIIWWLIPLRKKVKSK
jgi:4-amino-4-deoxy-L-arabinose transferase-like glycosyltransferase